MNPRILKSAGLVVIVIVEFVLALIAHELFKDSFRTYNLTGVLFIFKAKFDLIEIFILIFSLILLKFSARSSIIALILSQFMLWQIYMTLSLSKDYFSQTIEVKTFHPYQGPK